MTRVNTKTIYTVRHVYMTTVTILPMFRAGLKDRGPGAIFTGGPL